MHRHRESEIAERLRRRRVLQPRPVQQPEQVPQPRPVQQRVLHGSAAEPLSRSRWEQWRASVLAAHGYGGAALGALVRDVRVEGSDGCGVLLRHGAATVRDEGASLVASGDLQTAARIAALAARAKGWRAVRAEGDSAWLAAIARECAHLGIECSADLPQPVQPQPVQPQWDDGDFDGDDYEVDRC